MAKKKTTRPSASKTEAETPKTEAPKTEGENPNPESPKPDVKAAPAKKVARVFRGHPFRR